jgi:hypothetical protein
MRALTGLKQVQLHSVSANKSKSESQTHINETGGRVSGALLQSCSDQSSCFL